MQPLSDILSDMDLGLPLSPSPKPTFSPQKPRETHEIHRTVRRIQNDLEHLIHLLDIGITTPSTLASLPSAPFPSSDGQMIEGVFDGKDMVGPDGKQYAIPPNYASKSKLVEGDFLKLTITPNGTFLYKQIGPTKRKRIKGELIHDSDTHAWSVFAEGHTYKVLTASITFHRGAVGDEVVLVVPEHGQSSWGAVEHVIQNMINSQ